MQLKNPEILYFLALLIIPILVHLFQLQKFIKVPFTNVAFLKRIVQQTRKSSRIKKWLILANRILLFLAILFAFSQPYFSDKKETKKQHTYIYLDNSLSINSDGQKGNLLRNASQEIIDNALENDLYSLQTNNNFYEEITKPELKKLLLNLETSSKKIDFNTILLKIRDQNKNESKTLHKNILISDFQGNYNSKFTNVTPPFSAIQLKVAKKSNLSIDSVFINNYNAKNFSVNISIKNQGEEKNNIPIAIFNDDKLVSKQSFSIEKDSDKIISFTILNQPSFNGKIQLTFNDTFTFDNSFYFTLNSIKKINVLSIGNNADFLSKIYTENEFNFSKSTIQNVNYNSILKQQIIILNELESIPEILSKSILEFSKKGGDLVIIPNKNSNLVSYNLFLRKLSIGKMLPKKTDTLKITNINYGHPFFKNVFSKKVSNFQYPTVQSHYPISSKYSNHIVTFENTTAFISKLNQNTYYIASPLNKGNSNFLNSPLIVPIFYNFGKLSYKHTQLYYRIGKENKIDIEEALKKDEIVTVSNSQTSFIPLQQIFQNKVTITTNNKPLNEGFYNIISKKNTVQKLAFNIPKEESLLNFINLEELKKTNSNITTHASIKDVFTEINNKNEVRWLWKWFLALAIVSLLLEILILKFYKI